MTDAVASAPISGSIKPKLHGKTGIVTKIVFVALLLGGIVYAGHGFLNDLQSVHETLALGAFGLLGIALLIALGFEFVNGFHDTANAVATVIYTHSMAPVVAA